MKLDDELKLQILEKSGVYSNRFSIPEPKILLTSKEVLDMPRHMTEGRRTSAYKYYGVSYLQHNLVFINVRKIPDEKVLENTLVHELIHMAIPISCSWKTIQQISSTRAARKNIHALQKKNKSF